MDKANIIKALELCGHVNNPFVSGISACEGCPYIGMDNCDEQMCADAAAMLKANEPTKAKRYSQVYIFTKRTNLSKYLTCDVAQRLGSSDAHDRARKYYEHEREIQLIAMFRWEGNKCFCKIKCPINPMPVKGEFETPGTTGPVLNFLKENGWEFKQKLNPRLFE